MYENEIYIMGMIILILSLIIVYKFENLYLLGVIGHTFLFARYLFPFDKNKIEKDDVSAAANDYLKSLGYVSIAYAWIKILEVSFNDFNTNKEFYSDKINTAKFYFDKVLPRAEYHYKSAISGSSNIMNFKFN